MNKSIKGLFVGLCTRDIVYYIDEFPQCNHKIKTEEFATYIGGPATNAAITFASLGGDATIATCLGNSIESRTIIESLNNRGIKVLNYSESDAGPNTASIFVGDEGKRTIVSGQHAFTVNRNFDLDDFDFVLFDCNQQEIAIDILQGLKNETVVLDAGSYKPNIGLFLQKADIIISSEDFMDEDGNNIFALSCNALHKAITRGEKPILYNGTEIPVEQIEAVDTLGAGDIFHGAFCYAYFVEERACEEALRYASKVAGESIKYRGPEEWISHWR